ncbi:FAD-dependent oxidoreductase [Finegoldia magna]|uniref:FAD-dependent oxidoreductase n=1 Tax=Finegoldia magna TaxID=1260 RepID=UPI00290DCB33|nr:FAD-dependent oxidoreductase [Finegoldia magna]MDU6552007.1 FAD-dependent oxidoreductase [Finegoldia magna]
MKHLVLCGCGHGHIFVIKNIKEKYPDIKITVITDNEYQYYSGMYTGFLEGVYTHDEICFDVRKICEKYRADLIFDKIVKIDDENKKVIAKNHTVGYDYLSINLGATQKTIGTGENVINSKPINTIIDLKEKIKDTDKNILILGAGASGLVLAV